MVEGTHPIAEFLGHIEDGQHFISAIAVHMDQNVASQRACESFQFEIASGRGVGQQGVCDGSTV